MMILALEFSSVRRSVALARDGEVLSETVQQTDGRATNAFRLMEKTLSEAGLAREAIDVIVVGLGPGSYTGIRAAIAVAQGWQLARGTRLLGISSAEAIAVQAQAGKVFGRVNVVIDAQRNEFYRAKWEISANECREVSYLQLVPAAEIGSQKTTVDICVGPESGVIIFPSAAMVARLASGRNDSVPGQKLEPIYLREPNFVKSPASRAAMS